MIVAPLFNYLNETWLTNNLLLGNFNNIRIVNKISLSLVFMCVVFDMCRCLCADVYVALLRVSEGLAFRPWTRSSLMLAYCGFINVVSFCITFHSILFTCECIIYFPWYKGFAVSLFLDLCFCEIERNCI